MPDLDAFDALVGEWDTTLTHPMIDGTMHGHVSIEWLEGGAYLIVRSTIEHPDVPNSISVIGPASEDVRELDAPFMSSYSDSRGVHRIYAASMEGRTWRLRRDAAEFDQRIESVLSEDGSTIESMCQMRTNGVDWVDDLEVTYQRVR